MASENMFLELVGLCDRGALPLIDVRDDIRRHFKDGPDRQRIIKNLEAIQEAIKQFPLDYKKIRDGKQQDVTKAPTYVWPNGAVSSF